MRHGDMAGGTTLVAAGIVKHFQGVVALDGVDIALEPGRVTGLFGPNGSGKTTLVNCLSGVLTPTKGTIGLGGTRIENLARERRARLGLVRTYQNLRLFPALSVAENVETGLFAADPALGGKARRQLIDEALDLQGLRPHAHKAVSTLPYGLQKRTEIARALISHPRVLLLDEPAAGLGAGDWQSLVESLKVARQQMGFAMLLIDHNVAFVTALADTLTVLANGRVILSGEPQHVLANSEVARIYLGDAHAAT
ncbi:ABC transporter ATP-binding protein [Rhizobium sp. KVB221]|uniref:ABC transporter ATP-binding protein n=1 Tax=Rhizobium setariae TaxID=2801340 RepID=A0A937CLP8_9HYPH|nr:ATP-binding cassette domain-containing protein [Rhizobium setariae]MBL0373415.1 ABC transporter ATP-binding protein [Rhizobium setariae]